MSYINEDKSELLSFDTPDFPLLFRKNSIPSSCTFCDTSVHWHDAVEFIYVIEGKIGYLVNGKRLQLCQGQGLFVNSRQLHVILQNGYDCILYCLVFPPSLLCSSALIAEAVSDVVTADIPYILLSELNADEKAILDGIASIEEHTNDAFGRLETMRALYGIWHGLYMVANVTACSEPALVYDLILIRQQMLFVQEHSHESLSLEDICRAGNIGKTKCSQLFRKYLSTTPMGYLRDLRIEKSTKLLESGMSVSDAAASVGFSELSHFSKVFKAKMQVSPKEYIEKHRRNAQ